MTEQNGVQRLRGDTHPCHGCAFGKYLYCHLIVDRRRMKTSTVTVTVAASGITQWHILAHTRRVKERERVRVVMCSDIPKLLP